MKNRRSPIFLGVILFFVVMILCPFNVLAENVVAVPGIIEVEENHLYMVPIGTDDGVSKGDTVEIARDGQKIADARLISVLSDNSMVEIVVLFVRTDIQESDSVRFFKEEERSSRKKKTFGAESVVEELVTVVPKAAEERRRGLLGSEMHRYEEVTAVEGPLKKEIEQLKAGLVSVRDEYEGKVDTILSSVGGEKDVLAVEKKWKQKLVSTERRYQAQYRERKNLLERDAKRLEAKVAVLSNEMKIVNEGTDKRIQQLLSDLRDKEDEISLIKQEFVEEHLTGERQWKAKLETLEAQYQDQLRTQKEGFEKEFATERETLQNDIRYLTEQVNLVKESSGSQNDELQVRLKEREDLIASLRKEQNGLESDLSRESQQVRKLESDVATLKDVIGATKRVHAKELEFSRKPLETKIEDMSVEFISIKHDYERELNALRQSAQDDLLKNESQWVDKLADVEQKYQNEIGQSNVKSAAQVNELRVELEGQKDVVALLKQNQVELTSKLQASEQQFAQSQSDRNALENQLSVEKATRQEKINFAKQPLEEKVAELSAQMVSLRQEYEKQFASFRNDSTKETSKLQTKINEDAALINFLNNAMADLTSDLDGREQQVVQLQKDLKLSLGENEAMKKTYLERIELAKNPLEENIKSLSEEIASLKRNYDGQIKDIQENASRDLSVSEEQWQAKFVAMEKDRQKELDVVKGDIDGQAKVLEQKIVMLNKEHESALENANKEKSAIEQQWQARLNEAESGYQKTLDEELGKKQSVVDFLKEEKSDLIARMAASQKDHEIKIREMEIIAEQGQEAVNEQWRVRLAEMKDEHQKQLDMTIASLQKDHDVQTKEIKDVSLQKQTMANEQWQVKLEDTEKKYQDEIREIKNSSDSRITKLNEELQKERQTVGLLENETSGLSKQIVALQKNHEAEIKRVEDSLKQSQTVNNVQWQDKLNDIKAEHQKQLSKEMQEKQRVVSLLEGEKSEMTKQISALRKDHEAEKKRIENSLRQGQTASDTQWEKRIREKEKVVNLLEDDNGRLMKEIVSLKKVNEEEVARIESSLKQSQTASNEQWKSRLEFQEQTFKGEIAGLNDQLNLLKKDSNSVINDLQSQLKMKQNEMTFLKRSNSGLASSLAQSENKLVRSEDSMAVLKDQVKETQSSRSKWIASVKKPLEEEVRMLNDEIALLKKNYDNELKVAKNDAGADLAISDKQWQGKLKAQQDEYQKKQQEADTRYDELKTMMASLKDTHEKELKSFEDASKEKLSVSEKRFQAELAAQQEKSQKKLNEQNQDSEERIAGLNEQLNLARNNGDQTIGELRAQLEDRRRLVSSLEKRVSELTSTLEKKDQRLDELGGNISRLNQELKVSRSSYADQVRIAKQPLEEQIKTLNREVESLWDEAKKELKDVEGQWEDKLKAKDKEIESLWDEAKEELKTVEGEWRGKLKEKDREISRLRKKPEAEWKEKLVKNDEQWNEKFVLAEENYQKELQGKEEELQAKIVGLNGQLGLLKGDSNNVIDQLQINLKNKQNSISTLEKERSEFRLSLDRKDSELIELRSMLDSLKEDLRQSDRVRSDAVRSAKESMEDEVRVLKREMLSIKKDYEDKLKTEGPREVAALKDQIRELRGSSDRQLELLRNELDIERRVVADLEKEKASLQIQLSGDSPREKRLELANSSLEAEIKKLNSEMAFLNNDNEKKVEFVEQQAQEDLHSSNEIWQAKLAASEARWKTKWAVREAELQEETASKVESLEQRVFSGKKEVQETIVSLNNRLNMLKDGSDSQIRELEADLAGQQYQLTVREVEFQERLMEVDQQWSDKMALAEKRHQEELGKQKRGATQDFLDEKKELRETVIDLTRQFNELRDSSSDRVKDLENQVEQKDYRLSLLENRSQQDLIGTEEKWQAKLSAMEEKRQRELLEQKQELEGRFLSSKEKSQAMVGDLNRQINAMRDQFKLDLALKEEESAAEIALLERKYQDQLSGLKEGSSDQVDELALKVKKQQDLIESLESENSNLEFDLDQRERELARFRGEVDGLKKETKMTELSQSEKLRLSKQSLDAKIEELSSRLAITKEKTTQEREELEERWKAKLEKTEEDYLQKIKLQRQSLEEQTAMLDNKIGILKNDRGDTIKEMQVELEDNQTLIRLLSKEKYDLATSLEEKSRAIVRLNEDIIDLKGNLETYKDMLPLALSAGLDDMEKADSQVLATEEQTWYDSQTVLRENYYVTIRTAILNRFKEFDFSDYEGKEGVVKIDFELLANGSPKKRPEFLGTKDQGLKDLLTRCFEDALPFPPFPEDLGKESQRFSLGISFKKQ